MALNKAVTSDVGDALPVTNGHFELAARLLDAGADPKTARPGYTGVQKRARTSKSGIAGISMAGRQLTIAERHRFGNFKPSFVIVTAFHRVRKAAGGSIESPPRMLPGKTVLYRAQ